MTANYTHYEVENAKTDAKIIRLTPIPDGNIPKLISEWQRKAGYFKKIKSEDWRKWDGVNEASTDHCQVCWVVIKNGSDHLFDLTLYTQQTLESARDGLAILPNIATDDLDKSVEGCHES